MAELIHITNIMDDALSVYTGYKENQLVHIYEPLPGLFIAESKNVILRALQAGFEPVSLLLEEKEVIGQAKELIEAVGDIPVYVAPYEVLREITGYELTRGILCAMRRRIYAPMEEILQGKRNIAVLDSVQNPTNVGAIFRSAAALGIEAVVLTGDCADPLYRRAIRVSMGNVFLIPWTYVEKQMQWPKDGMQKLHDMGFTIIAMALENNSVSLDDPSLQTVEKKAILLGNEGYGLSKETIESSDITVKIPMTAGVDSLNVAAASAVTFWQLCR